MPDKIGDQMSAQDGQSDRVEADQSKPIPIHRSPELPLAPVDVAVVGFMGRDFTISGLAGFVNLKSATPDTTENVVGFDEIDFAHGYRETCSLRLAPETAGQLALSLIQGLKEADSGAYQTFLNNISERVGLVERE